jgi:hypothetical protein
VSAPLAARRRRPGPVGLALTLVYVLACVATLALTGDHVRPLFEGVGPNSPYEWVNPPKEFAAGNVRPKPVSTDVTLDATGSQSTGLTSSDGQFVLTLDAGAVAPRAGNDHVRVSFAPRDPATLGRLPRPLRADGNAYRVTMSYRPSGDPVAGLQRPAVVLVQVPEPSDTLLFSSDGRMWTRIETRHEPGSGGESASFAGLGYYVAGTSRPPATAVAPGGRGYGTAVVILAVALVAVALAWTPYIVTRRRERAQRRR